VLDCRGGADGQVTQPVLVGLCPAFAGQLVDPYVPLFDFCSVYRQRFGEEIFPGEDFMYLYDELFTPGNNSSRS
jgi:hypothetical protein